MAASISRRHPVGGRLKSQYSLRRSRVPHSSTSSCHRRANPRKTSRRRENDRRRRPRSARRDASSRSGEPSREERGRMRRRRMECKRAASGKTSRAKPTRRLRVLPGDRSCVIDHRTCIEPDKESSHVPRSRSAQTNSRGKREAVTKVLAALRRSHLHTLYHSPLFARRHRLPRLIYCGLPLFAAPARSLSPFSLSSRSSFSTLAIQSGRAARACALASSSLAVTSARKSSLDERRGETPLPMRRARAESGCGGAARSESAQVHEMNAATR